MGSASEETADGREWALILGVTGSSGSAIARAVARDPGLNVFGIHRGKRPDGAPNLQATFGPTGRRLHLHVADGASADEVDAAASAVLEVVGARKVKLLVHAIASAYVGPLLADGDRRLDQRRLERSFSAMAHSFVYWVQALVARDLLAPEARLLGLSNPMEDSVVAGAAVVAATKAALGAYVRHLAHELGPRGHRVNLLKFGAITTQAVQRVFGKGGPSPMEDVLKRAIPARRLCTPDEVGRFVSVLAGDAGAWFNGATIDFTGGEFQGLMSLLVPTP